MIKIDFKASIEKIVSNTVANGETKKKTRVRESKVDHDYIDLTVYRAILKATAKSIRDTLSDLNRSVRNGIKIGDLLLSLPKFSKNDATNRAIVKESIDSLQERRLVRSTDRGSFQFIAASDGGYYREILDKDVYGVIIGKRVVTSFFSRDDNPLTVLYKQQKEKAESIRVQNEQAEQIREEIHEEEWQEPELEFEDDSFSDNDDFIDDSGLNSDTPE